MKQADNFSLVGKLCFFSEGIFVASSSPPLIKSGKTGFTIFFFQYILWLISLTFHFSLLDKHSHWCWLLPKSLSDLTFSNLKTMDDGAKGPVNPAEGRLVYLFPLISNSFCCKSAIKSIKKRWDHLHP